MKFRQPLFAMAAMALTTQAFAQSAAPASAPDAGANHMLAPAGKVLGLGIHNATEKNMGEIGDLLIDPRSGEIRYAVLEVGGFLGMNEDRRIVPWAYVQVLPGEKDADKIQARTTLTEAQVKAAPTCKSDQMFDAELDRRIEASFGKDDAWAFHGEGKAAFMKLSQMDGVMIKESGGKEVGKVEDFVLAPQNGCIAYAIVDTNKDAGGKKVALPYSRLQYAVDAEKKLVGSTTVDLPRFQSAPEYDSGDWKRMSSMPWMTELGTYYSTEPFWKTSRFATARKAPAQKP